MSQVEKMIARLYEPANNASDHAYSPYSGAKVGACVLDDDGNLYTLSSEGQYFAIGMEQKF